MTDVTLIVDLYKGLERLGPGSRDETLKALEFINLPDDRSLQVADIGCGTGAQTLTLAEHIQGQITAVDLFPEFLAELEKRTKEIGLADKIQTLQASMDDLPFEPEQFDIIWSEGSIYLMGFEKGINDWKKFLKPGGYLAVSEITWLTNSRPNEVEEFWAREYPEMDTASGKINCLENLGFTPEGYFYLDKESWFKNYYQPLSDSFNNFLKRNNHSTPATKLVTETRAEMDLYQKYSDYFSYGFYIARKI